MLTALLDRVRIYASAAEKGHAYVCPACRKPLILRKGSVKIHHFAHRPPVDCAFGSGETMAHMQAKLALYEGFRNRSHVSEVEWPLKTMTEERRADLFVRDMSGASIVFELQHTPIGIDEIAARSAAYMSAGIAVVWIPFLRARYRGAAERGPGGRGAIG